MKLKLVSLPIGNLEDITLRALNELKAAQFILAEDTRNTKKLLGLLGIGFDDKEFISFHDHSEAGAMESRLTGQLKNKEFVYVSDAGSPIISDPGVDLVKLVKQLGGEVDTIPGPSSMVAALELSGLPSIPFHFHGFVARKKGDLEKFFQQLLQIKGTHVFFESPNRVVETARCFLQMPEHPSLVICREITKLYQQTYVLHQLEDLENQQNLERGELVCLFHVDKDYTNVDQELVDLANEVIESGPQVKILSKLLSRILKYPAKEIYQRISQVKDNQ